MRFPEGYVLPTVRIQKIKMENFKSVQHGEVVFNCGRKFVPQDTEADILGIYGQNGTGKTSVIEAISILERAMAGRSIQTRYSECISEGADYAKLTFTFDFQYPKSDEYSDEYYKRTVLYSFKITAIPNEESETQRDPYSFPNFFSNLYPKKIKIFDETISASGMFSDGMQIKQDILTTSGGNYPIGPVRKIQQYVGNDKDEVLIELSVNQRTAADKSKSFIFMDETMDLFQAHSNYSEYYLILAELQHFALFYLYAVDTRTSGMGEMMYIPINTRYGVLALNLIGSLSMPQDVFDELESFVKGINTVLPAIIPNMNLTMIHNNTLVDGEQGQEVQIFSKRKETLIPLRDESAGILKIISVLSLIAAAFNDRSITVAIDELDAGIYEYLLGEILSSLEMYGKGQLVFTSHNLRPLEVLKKENILFTTSNPDNRFIRLKGVGKTNNLRNLYFREILSDTQDEQIYDAAKRQRMIAAFMKAGVGNVKEK